MRDMDTLRKDATLLYVGSMIGRNAQYRLSS